jgi:hypothetical protein
MMEMRDVYKAVAYVEHIVTSGLDRKLAPPREMREKPKPSNDSIRAWRAPATTNNTQYPEQVFKPRKDRSMAQTQLPVTTRALKVTAVLDAAAVATLPVPEGQPRTKLTISCEGRNYTADVAAKSLRKVKATIVANGVENVVVIVQGKLKNDGIVDCGIVAQLKVTKTADSSPEAKA